MVLQRGPTGAPGARNTAGRTFPGMVIIGPLFALVGRFAGRVLNAALGWATLLLFGKVEDDKQGRLLLVALGSLAWVVLVVGVAFPDVGTTILAFVPVPDFVDEAWVRLAMLAGAIVLPLGIGVLAILSVRPQDRPTGIGLVKAVLRGYPFALVLAATIVLLSAVALVRKARSLHRRWEDGHVPIIVKPGGYEGLLAELEGVLDAAGLAVERRPAPRLLSLPPRILDRVAGRGLGGLVPDELMLLTGDDLEIFVYPSDIAISGARERLARARAAIADRLTDAPAYLTVSESAQRLEDRLADLARRNPEPVERAEVLGRIDAELASLAVPYDEWETLYRQRLQVERNLIAGAAGQVVPPLGTGAAMRPLGEAGAFRRPAEASRVSQAVGLAGMALLAAYAGFLVLYRILPERRG